MSLFNHRKILLTLFSVVFAICCFFAIQSIYAYAEDSDSSATAVEITLSADTDCPTTVTEDTIIYLNGKTLMVKSSVTVEDGASLTIYAGTSDTDGSFCLTSGTVSGSFNFTGSSIGSGYYLTVGGDSVTVAGNVDIYGTVSVTTFTVSSGELYVQNPSSGSSLNGGYALTASYLNVNGGATSVVGSHANYDIKLATTSGSGTFNYSKGSFYTNRGTSGIVDSNGKEVSPSGLVYYDLGLKSYEGDKAGNTNKAFPSVSKVYVDGVDYNIVITNTANTADNNKTGINHIALYLSGADHKISIVDGDDLWATYEVTYNSGTNSFTLSKEIDSPSVDLAAGSVEIYSQYYLQNGEKILWGGEYNFVASSSTSNTISVVSDNDVKIIFTGGGTFTASTVVTFATENSGANPTFKLYFGDDEEYNFGTSGTAVSITGGSLELCESGSTNNVIFGMLSIRYAAITLNGGTISNKSSAVYVVHGEFTMNGGEICDNNYAIYSFGDCKVTINDGSIYNNNGSSGVIYMFGGVFTMNGGQIYGNTGRYASAIYAEKTLSLRATLYLNGGIITDNCCTAESDGGTVVCSGSDCIVDGAFIYGNYKTVNGVTTDCYELNGDSSSDISIVSGVVASCSDVVSLDDTVPYTVNLDNEITLSEISFRDNADIDSAKFLKDYTFTDVILSTSVLYVYGDANSYMFYITDSSNTTYTYALFTGDQGYAAKQITAVSGGKYYIDEGGEYYFTSTYESSTVTYESITVSVNATIYIEDATITTLNVNDDVTLNIYIIGSNTITSLAGSGSVVIQDSGSVTFKNVISSSLNVTVNGGIITFNTAENAKITVTGGAFVNGSNVTATNADGEELTIYTISFGKNETRTVNSVTVDNTDYSISGSMSSLSLFLTQANHTVIVDAGTHSYVYTISWSSGVLDIEENDGDLLYDLNGGSITITATGYTEGDGTEIEFNGSYIIYSSSQTDKTITINGNAEITLSGVNGGSLTINSGTVNITLTDGTQNTFTSVLVESGATLNLYCSNDSAYFCADNLDVYGSLNIKGGTVQASAIEVDSNATLDVNGGTVEDAIITVSGTLKSEGGVIDGATITVSGSGTFTISGGEVNNSTITAEGKLYISGGSSDNLVITISGTAEISGGSVTDAQITVSGTFNITGGTIYGINNSLYSSAVTLSGGTVTMSGGEIYGNSALSSDGAVYINSSSSLEMSGGIVSGGLYVENGGTLEVSGGVITYASGDGTATITGGYVCGDLTSAVSSDGSDIYLIELVLPQSADISKLAITVDGVSYTIGQSYTADVIYIYGGSLNNDSIECTVVLDEITYIYSLERDYSLSEYILPESIELDVSLNSYELYESSYYIKGEDESSRHVSYGYYVIVQRSEVAEAYADRNTLTTYGNVTIEFSGVTGMTTIIVESSGLVLYGDAQFDKGISSNGSITIADGTFVAAYVDSIVTITGGSLTIEELTSVGYIVVEDGEFYAETVNGTLYISGGYVTIENTVCNDTSIKDNTANVIINGGSVNATFAKAPKNSSNNTLYMFTPDISDIEGEIYSVMVDSAEYNIYGSYTQLYLWLTAQSHVVSVETAKYYTIFNIVYSGGQFIDYDIGILDISEGSIVITSTGYTIGDAEEETAYTGDYVIRQTAEESDDETDETAATIEETTNTIKVDGATVTIYLYTLLIATDDDFAISITGGADVTIILPDEAYSTISAYLASIYVDETSSLTISCAHSDEDGHDDCYDCGMVYSAYESRIFYVQGTLTVNGGYYTGGYADEGGAIYVDGGTVNINGGWFSGNYADYGGAIFIESGNVNIYGSYIIDNVASYGGGVFVNGGKLYMDGGSIQYNDSYYGGGVFVNDGTFTYAGGSLYINNADYSGGAIYSEYGTAVNIYGGEISLNTLADGSTDGSAIYTSGTLKIYGGIITEENSVYGDEYSTVSITGGSLSIYAYGTLTITGGSVNVLDGDATNGENTVYSMEFSIANLQAQGIETIEIDGVAIEWDFSDVLSSATSAEYLYVWADSSSHLVTETASNGTSYYYIAVFNGSSFTLHSAKHDVALSQDTTLDEGGYYYIDVDTAGIYALTVSANSTIFLSGEALSILKVTGGSVVNVYGLNGFEVDAITVESGVLILSGITASSAVVEDGYSLKISSSQIDEVTLGESSKLILGSGEISISTIYISCNDIAKSPAISVSDSPAITGIITIEFDSTVTTKTSVLFTDSSVLDYSRYFVSGDSTYSILEESGGLRLVASYVTLTVEITGGGSVTINGTEYFDGDTVNLANAASISYTVSYNPDTYYYLSSVTLNGTDLSGNSITLTADSTLSITYEQGVAAAYSNNGTTYVGAYATLEDAVAGGNYVVLLADNYNTGVSIKTNVTLNLNGYSATGVTVKVGYTLTVTGEGYLEVNNEGSLIVYGGIVWITNTDSGPITAYGGAFISGTDTVTDGNSNTLTAVKITLPDNTYAVYVDNQDYSISYASEKDVYLYLSDDVEFVVVESASGYIVYSISSGTATLEDYTVYDISQGFIKIDKAGTYFIMQTGSDIYGITVDVEAVQGSTQDVTIYFNNVSIQSATYALRIVSGDVTVNGDTIVLSGTLGDIVLEGGSLTVEGTFTGDITVADGTITVNGTLTGDITATDSTINVTGTVDGDITATDCTVTLCCTQSESITESGTVTVNVYGTINNLALYGDSNVATVSGIINNDVVVYGGTLDLNGLVRGNVTAEGGTINTIVATSGSAITIYGDLTVNNGDVNITSDTAVYGDVVVQAGTLILNSDVTLTISDCLYMLGGNLISNGIMVGSVNLSGGNLEINYSYEGALEVNGGTLVIHCVIFYGTLTVNGGSTTINGGLFTNTVTIADGAYCAIAGGAFANEITGRKLYEVPTSDTSITKVTINGTDYEVSVTLTDAKLYLAGGYVITINDTPLSADYSGGTTTTDIYTIISSGGTISESGSYLIDGGFTSYINITYTGTDDINIYLQGCGFEGIIIANTATATVNIYVESGTNTIGSITNYSSTAKLNIYINGGTLTVTSATGSGNSTSSLGDTYTTINSSLDEDSDGVISITASGTYLIGDFTGTITINYTGTEAINIYLQGCTLTAINVSNAATVNIYAEGDANTTNTIGSIENKYIYSTINIYVNGGTLKVTYTAAADSIVVNGGTLNGTTFSNTIRSSEIDSDTDGYDDGLIYISVNGTYYINNFTFYVDNSDFTGTGTIYINYTEDKDINIYLSGCYLDGIIILNAATVNIYVEDGINTIGSIVNNDSEAKLNIYVNGGLLYVEGAVAADSIIIDGGMIAAEAFTNAVPYSSDSSAVLAVIDISDLVDTTTNSTNYVSYVWLAGPDNTYGFAIDCCTTTNLYLWYEGTLSDYYVYTATILLADGTYHTVYLTYSQDAGILANIIYDESVFTAVTVDYGNTWTVASGYTAQYYVDGEWTETAPTAVGTYSVRLVYTLGSYTVTLGEETTVGGYTVYMTYDSWIVTIQSVEITLNWQNQSIGTASTDYITATADGYNVTITLYYYDADGNLLESAPTAAGVYLVKAECGNVGYTLTNATVIYVIGINLGNNYSNVEVTVTGANTYAITNSNEYTVTGSYIYLDYENSNVYYVVTSSGNSYTYVYDEATQEFVRYDFGTFDISYGDLEIDGDSFTYCGVTYAGYSGEYIITGENEEATVTVGAGSTAYITLDSCTLNSIGGEGTIVLTVSKGYSSVQDVQATLVVMQKGSALSYSLVGLTVTDEDYVTLLYACEVELDGTYAVTNINIDGTNYTVSFTASSFVLYLTAESHTVIVTFSGGTAQQYEATYSNGFTCTKSNTDNSWKSTDYVITVDGEVVSADKDGTIQITCGKSFTVSGYTAAYGEVTYLYSSAKDGEYTAAVPTTAGTYYVKAYVAEGGGYNELYANEVQTIIIVAATEDTYYTIILVTYGGEEQTIDYANGYSLNTLTLNDSVDAPAGFTFYQWQYADGTPVDISITISSDITLYAVYAATLTLNIEGTGTVSINGEYTASGSVTMYYGTEYVITASGNGTAAAHIYIDGELIDDTTYTLPSGSCEVEVVFDTNGIEVLVGRDSSGASIGIYSTVAEAVEAAQGYSYVYMVLYADIGGSAEISGNVTINLNGHAWSTKGTTVTGSLTIVDEDISGIATIAEEEGGSTSAASAGTVTGTITVQGGTLNICGGTVSSIAVRSGVAYVSAGTVLSVTVSASAALDISGGNVISVTGSGEVVSGSSTLYSLQIPVSYDITSIVVTYSGGSQSSYENASAVDGTVYLWLSSDATSVTFTYVSGTETLSDTHTITYKNGAFTLSNAWTSSFDIDNYILDKISYGETVYDDAIYTDFSALQAVIQAKYGEIILQYSSDEGATWSDEYPLSAGTYYVRIYVAAGGNYTSLASDSVTVTINKNTADSYDMYTAKLADSVFTQGAAISVVYDGSQKAVTVNINNGTAGVITVYYSTDGKQWTATAPADAGTYYFKIDVGGTDSIEACEVSSSEVWLFTITAATVTSPAQDTAVYTYSGVLQTYNLAVDNNLYTISGNSQVNAGTYTVTVTLTDGNNYVWSEGDDDGDGVITYTFVIEKFAVEKPAADSTKYVYTGNTIIYNVAESDYYTVSGSSQKNAGTYSVTITLISTSNYCWAGTSGSSESLTYTFTISKADANLSAEGVTITYSDDVNIGEYIDVHSDSDSAVTITYYLDGEVTDGITASGTYTVVISVAETTNYNGGVITITVTVNKASQADTAAATAQSSTSNLYKGDSYKIDLEGLLISDGTVTYTSSDENVAIVSEDGFVTLVGTGSYTITVTLTGDSCYDDWTFEFEEITVKYNFTWLYILISVVAVMLVGGAVTLVVLMRRRKVTEAVVKENSIVIDHALALYEQEAIEEEERLAKEEKKLAEDERRFASIIAAYSDDVVQEEAEVEAEEEQPLLASEEQPVQDVAQQPVQDEIHMHEAVEETAPAEPDAAIEPDVPAEDNSDALTEEEAETLMNRYRENEVLIRKLSWGADEG